jgi:hypothetical protein
MSFSTSTCSILDDHISPRRSALLMARSVLRTSGTNSNGVVQETALPSSEMWHVPNYFSRHSPSGTLSDIIIASSGLRIKVSFGSGCHHHLPDRNRAQALISVLALPLYCVMRMRLKLKGHSASPETALKILAKVQRFTAFRRRNLRRRLKSSHTRLGYRVTVATSWGCLACLMLIVALTVFVKGVVR